MSRYVVVGGFLGAGKTTTLMAISSYLEQKGKKAAILVNDLGAKNLVDGSFTGTSGFVTEEITSGCICYQTENLVDKLRRFRDVHQADLILSDIPGCGIGGLDHVYHKLTEEYPGEVVLAPFTAVADPERLRVIMPEQADLHLPKEMEYLFDAQLREAEVIVLNKTDLLTEEEKEKILKFLRENYSTAKVFAISAKEGTGIAELSDYLMETESQVPVREIGYGGPEFLAAEEKMSWYNRQCYLTSEEEFDGNQFLESFFDAVRGSLTAIGRNVPHLKAMGETAEGDMAKLSLLGVDYPVQFDRRLKDPCLRLRVIVNARAVCESETLDNLMDIALKETAKAFGLSLRVFFTECFGMMDDGFDEA